jgi:hypothetical protein
VEALESVSQAPGILCQYVFTNVCSEGEALSKATSTMLSMRSENG